MHPWNAYGIKKCGECTRVKYDGIYLLMLFFPWTGLCVQKNLFKNPHSQSSSWVQPGEMSCPFNSLLLLLYCLWICVKLFIFWEWVVTIRLFACLHKKIIFKLCTQLFPLFRCNLCLLNKEVVLLKAELASCCVFFEIVRVLYIRHRASYLVT